MYDLRHAHASWLLAGGADIQTVRERLGHASLRATERYLHTLAESDEMARSRPGLVPVDYEQACGNVR
ncbi:tyrosine-type recombinase/integrase [Saccharothrix ecbatanensis]|nr:tyrosine-type recombinase/integrase [Saccharothrix ecbatanensis]